MRSVDLTSGSIYKKITIVAVPAIMTTLMQMLFNLVDIYFISDVGKIGQSSTDAISAVGVGGYYLWLSAALIMSFRVGVDSLVPREVGNKNEKRVNEVIINALLIAFSFALIVFTIGMLFAPSFVNLFNFGKAKITNDTIAYIRIIAIGIFAFFITPVFSSTLNGFGRSKDAFFISLSGLVLNIILDPIFIINLKLGVAGAAMATVISQYFSLTIFIIYFLTKNTPIKLKIKSVINKKAIKDILKLGTPVGVQAVSFSMIGVIQGILISSFGEAAVATARLGSQIEQLSWLVGSGFMVAFSAFIGQNIGAKQYERVKEGFYKGSLIVTIYGIFITIIMFTLGFNFFQLFNAEEQVLLFANDYIKIVSFSVLFGVFEGAVQGAFSGIGQTRNVSIFLFIANVIRLPLSYLLVPVLGINAIWVAITISTNLKGGGLLIWFFIKLKNKSYIPKQLNETLS